MYLKIMNCKLLPCMVVAAVFFFTQHAEAQKATSPKPGYVTAWSKPAEPKKLTRPRLVVGIVVDQMRWDYLYRYTNRYIDGGFKRLLKDGFSCENTLINYTPTITACGHTCVYTGSVPAVHGIVGNGWYSREMNRDIYCAEDSTVNTVGATSKAGKMSPRNMDVTTIGDELRLATNFRSKVVGVAIKDRGAILPAGHSATAAYWYDGTTGNWVSSSYYMQQLPDWATEFNNMKWPARYLSQPWSTLYPIETYQLSTTDNKPYEGTYAQGKAPVFPHQLGGESGTPFKSITSTPFGNTMTLEFAKKAVEAYQLGKGDVTDMLTVSLSSTDAVGHQFGPNAIEIEDTYLRLDKDLASFFKYLDATVGKGQYLFFITADHGVAHVPGFMQENKLPGGNWSESKTVNELNKIVKEQAGIDKVIAGASNYQLYLNHDAIAKAQKSTNDIRDLIINVLLKDPAIANAFPLHELLVTPLAEPMRTMMTNGFNRKRSGDIQLVLKPGFVEGGKTGTSHGQWYAYDAHIPLVWMGWGVRPGKTNRTVGMTDIAPTVAAMLHIQMPSGNVGHVIEEITR